MVRLWFFVVLAAGGCDRVLGLDPPRPPPPDAPPDAPPPPCENLVPFGTDCRTITAPVLADTALDSTMPGLAVGTRDALRISNVDPGLYKFDISMIAPGERIAEARLRLGLITGGRARACTPQLDSCAICMSSVEGWELYWVTPLWSQQFATYNEADQGVPWSAPGAAGVDRSELVANGPAPLGLTLEVTASQPELLRVKAECFATATDLAMLVLVRGTGWFRQYTTQQCAADRPPVLELVVCR